MSPHQIVHRTIQCHVRVATSGAASTADVPQARKRNRGVELKLNEGLQ